MTDRNFHGRGSPFSGARWMMDHDFADVDPLNIFHKQYGDSGKMVKEQQRHDLANMHMLARKTVVLSDEADGRGTATLTITADDYYKLYVNGVFVGQGPAQSYHFHHFYNVYDVSQLLRPGVNVIAVHVYYLGKLSRALTSGDARQGLIAALSVDGRNVAATDETWRITRAKQYIGTETIGYNTQYMEDLDERLAEHGWKAVGFDDAHWQVPAIRWHHGYTFILQPTPDLSVYHTIPAEVRKMGAGRYIIDFGRQITGYFTMRAVGEAGQIVEIRCGEELNPDGTVRYELRANCRYCERWILSGGQNELEPYDYKGFRYVEVIEDRPAVDPESFSAVVRHYPFPGNASRFTSSNSLLDRIWDLCENGVRCNAQENYIDCPTREKGQYLGDNTVIAPAHFYLTGDLRLYRKSLRDFALLSEKICPGFMAVAPGGYMQEIADYSLQWPMQLLQYYRYSGETHFLREMLPYAEGILNYFRKYRREDGLLEDVLDKWNLVDWPANMRDGYDFPLTQPPSRGCHNVINALFYGAMRAVHEIREELGLGVDKREAECFRASFAAAFFRSEQSLFADAATSSHCSLHANVFPLLFGMYPNDETERAVQFLVDKRLSCGVYMSYFYLKALASAGRHEQIFQLLISEEAHAFPPVREGDAPVTTYGYWANMLREGGTACFESWSLRFKKNGSMCHAWSSAPIPILVEDIAGLTPAAPGWTAISFAPHIPDTLSEFHLELTVPTGKIYLSSIQGEIHLEVPDGVTVNPSSPSPPKCPSSSK